MGATLPAKAFGHKLATLTNWVEDWTTKPALKAAVEILGLTDWVGELDTANKSFNGIFMQRNAEVLDNPDEQMKNLRQEGYKAYYDLKKMIEAQALISGYTEPYTNLMRELNNLIDTYNQTLAVRAGKAAAKNGGVGDVPVVPPANPV